MLLKEPTLNWMVASLNPIGWLHKQTLLLGFFGGLSTVTGTEVKTLELVLSCLNTKCLSRRDPDGISPSTSAKWFSHVFHTNVEMKCTVKGLRLPPSAPQPPSPHTQWIDSSDIIIHLRCPAVVEEE